MDSKELSDRVYERLDGVPPIVKDRKPGVGIDIHAIVKAVLEELAEQGILILEPPA